MAITDEQKQKLSELMFQALDNVEQNFPEEADATITAGILITEIMFTPAPDSEPVAQVAWFTTDGRVSINFGLLESARLGIVKTKML